MHLVNSPPGFFFFYSEATQEKHFVKEPSTRGSGTGVCVQPSPAGGARAPRTANAAPDGLADPGSARHAGWLCFLALCSLSEVPRDYSTSPRKMLLQAYTCSSVISTINIPLSSTTPSSFVKDLQSLVSLSSSCAHPMFPQ